MNTNPYLLLTISALTIGLAVPTKAAQILNNGNLETFSNGIPTAWVYTQGDGTPTLESTESVSPFKNVYASSTRSVLLTDATAQAFFPVLEQAFPSQTGSIVISFEFQLPSLTGSTWLFLPSETSAYDGFTLNNIILGGSLGVFALIDDSGYSSVLTLTAGTWYQASIALNLPSSTYSGSITPFGGNATTWSNRSLFESADLGRLGFYDYGDAANGSIAIDNVSVQTVPEPSTLVLLGLGGSWILMRRLIG